MTQVSCESRGYTWALGPGPRALDVTLGIPLLLLALIPMAVIALALLLTQGRPILFVQCRLGRGERRFTLHKFRTLPAGAARTGLVAAANPEPPTTLASWLRQTRLDELPQLYDVLRGAMSLVGPRPEPPAVANAVATTLRSEVLAARPGLTSRVSLAFLCEDDVLEDTRDSEGTYRQVLVPEHFRRERQELVERTLITDLITLGQSALLPLRQRRDAACRQRVLALLAEAPQS